MKVRKRGGSLRVTSTILTSITTSEFSLTSSSTTRILISYTISDEPLRGPMQEFDFGTDDEEVDQQPIPVKSKRSKQSTKTLSTASDVPSNNDDSSSSEDDDGPITKDNIAERSRKLETLAAEEAALVQEELKESAFAAAEEDEDLDMSGEEDENGDVNIEPFRLPTVEEREEEKAKGGPDVYAVQRRMRECARVLSKFKKRAEQGRCVVFLTSLFRY